LAPGTPDYLTQKSRFGLQPLADDAGKCYGNGLEAAAKLSAARRELSPEVKQPEEQYEPCIIIVIILVAFALAAATHRRRSLPASSRVIVIEIEIRRNRYG
jgi:hypothetical protein